MPGDDVTLPKSAFVPFNNGYPNPSDVITGRPFTYIHPTQDHVTRTGCLYPPNRFSNPPPIPISRCFEQVEPNLTTFETSMDNNVANCVTVSAEDEEDDQEVVGPNIASTAVQNVFDAIHSVFPSQMPAPVMPLIIQSRIHRAENLPPRQVHYHKRHHPSAKTTSKYDVSASELKNKSRFSATGASGKSTVVRDCKMSLSSSPPSPCAGSVGGSLCSSISRSHFKPISAQCQLFASTRSSATALPYSPTKQISTTSASPTTPSISPSSRSSTSSSSGIGPRKRRADEENTSRAVYRSSGSTSDVTAGVGHVRLCDRSSTGSVSPVESVMRPCDWVSPQQPHKRSKNDNDEDDDVIFVSMEPGPKHKSSLSNISLKPFTGVPPKHTVKASRKSKKNSAKKSPATPMVSTTPFSMPSPMYPHQNVQLSSAVPTSFAAPPVATPASVAAVSMHGTVPSKGYFLRSSVATRSENKEYVSRNKLSAPQLPTQKVPTSNANARYQTRSNQKRKEDRAQHPAPYIPQPHSISGASLPAPSPPNKSQPSSSITDKLVGVHHPKSVESAERSRSILLNDPHRRASSTSFSKIYDIKGKIGVGGGGVVYAG